MRFSSADVNCCSAFRSAVLPLQHHQETSCARRTRCPPPAAIAARYRAPPRTRQFVRPRLQLAGTFVRCGADLLTTPARHRRPARPTRRVRAAVRVPGADVSGNTVRPAPACCRMPQRRSAAAGAIRGRVVSCHDATIALMGKFKPVRRQEGKKAADRPQGAVGCVVLMICRHVAGDAFSLLRDESNANG